jgi:hypothetical protein
MPAISGGRASGRTRQGADDNTPGAGKLAGPRVPGPMLYALASARESTINTLYPRMSFREFVVIPFTGR